MGKGLRNQPIQFRKSPVGSMAQTPDSSAKETFGVPLRLASGHYIQLRSKNIAKI